MPSLNSHILLQLKDDFKKYKTFVETGTYMGGTVINMDPFFEKIYTVEITPKYHHFAKENYSKYVWEAEKHGIKTDNQVQFLLGDSDEVFRQLLPTLNGPAIFFLDGHWSCEDTGHGKKHVPLLEELTHINSLFKGKAILIIDDFRLFETDTDVDWKDINKTAVLNILKDRITEVYHLDSVCAKNDRLIVHIKPL